MEEIESVELGAAVDEDEVLLADKPQGVSTSGSDDDDRLTENVTLNF
jgi:hypothetical protein